MASNDPASVPQSPSEDLPYPKSVFFIICNEFCERFNYVGMRAILVLYFRDKLKYSKDTSTVLFHFFGSLLYGLCLLGAIVSDSWWGKFKTILHLSLVYVWGSILLAFSAIPYFISQRSLTMTGLTLIAIGSGGIKPCVAAFGADQFVLPEQLTQMATYFSMFYFMINAGSLVSTMVTPILREDVHCFGDRECYPLAFGVPAILMALSIVIFVLGRPLYNLLPPAENGVVLVCKAVVNALSTKWKENERNPREHWLDYADNSFEPQLIDDIKVLIRVLVLFLPVPVFWALFDQQGSRWVLQAVHMDGDMGTWDIKPDQMHLLNPLMILILIPLFDFVIYPALSLVGIRRPLQKMTLGGILAGIGFIISALVEQKLENTYPIIPKPDFAQLRVFNGELCSYHIFTNIYGEPNFDVKQMDWYVNKDIPLFTGEFNLTYTITLLSTGDGCFEFPDGWYTMTHNKAHSLFLSSKNPDAPLQWYIDNVEKNVRGKPMVRTLCNTPPDNVIMWKSTTKGFIEYRERSQKNILTEFDAGTYGLFVNDVKVTEVRIRSGGVYTIVVNQNASNQYYVNVFEVTDPNTLHMFWLLPQYLMITLAEVMFAVTGMSFTYAQSPVSMKSVMQAIWLLTVAFGDVIIIIIASLNMFESQASEFVLFAVLMFVNMFVFSLLAYRYKPNNPNTLFMAGQN